jgi:hypothetical protein
MATLQINVPHRQSVPAAPLTGDAGDPEQYTGHTHSVELCFVRVSNDAPKRAAKFLPPTGRSRHRRQSDEFACVGSFENRL